MPDPQKPIVRSWPVYYNNRKIATAYEKSFKFNAGRTKVFGSDGYLCHSKGAPTSSINIKMAVPQRGVNVQWLADLLNQNDVEIGVPANGQIIQVTMAATEGSLSANTEKGTCEGDLTLEGGKASLN